MKTQMIVEVEVPEGMTPEAVRLAVAGTFPAARVYFPKSQGYLSLLRAGGGVRKDTGNQIADYIEFLEYKLSVVAEGIGNLSSEAQSGHCEVLQGLCKLPFDEPEWRKQEYRRRTIEAAVKYVVTSPSNPMREHHWDKLVDAVRLLRGLK